MKLEDAGELDALSARHAAYYAANWPLDHAAEDGPDNTLAELGNLRAVLEWTLIREHDVTEGCKLAASYAKLLLGKSMLGEARKWTEIALSRLDDRERGGLMELELVASYGHALMFTGNDSQAVGRAYERGLAIATSLGDDVRHDRLLCGLIMYLYRISDFDGAFVFASEAAQWIGANGRDTSAVHSMLGVALHMKGDIASSTEVWESVIESGQAIGVDSVEPAMLAINSWLRALSGKARNLWLTSHAAQAARVADQAIEKARSLRHPATQCVTLLWAGEVFAWDENWARLSEITDEFDTLVNENGFTPYRYVAFGLRGQLAYAQGKLEHSIAMLEACLDGMKKSSYTMVASTFRNALAMALCESGDTRRAIQVCEQAITEIESNSGELYLPDLLITKAKALKMTGDSDASAACVREALLMARRQGSTAYEAKIWRIGSFGRRVSP
jgi:hypothetical protein